MIKFATPKDNVLPAIYNFKKYETARRIKEDKEIRNYAGRDGAYLDPRGEYEDSVVSSALSREVERNRETIRGFSRVSVGGIKSVGVFAVEVEEEFIATDETVRVIRKAFPAFKGAQKIYKITFQSHHKELSSPFPRASID